MSRTLARGTPLPAMEDRKARKEGILRHLTAFDAQFRTRQFWLVQGLVLTIAIIHDTIEIAGWMPHLGLLYFLPITLFSFPVVYAGLNFGFHKAFATSLWVTVLTVPNWFLWHDGLERIGVMVQFFIIIAISLLVGWKVDHERSARKQAEAAGAKLSVSEARYRHLFETSPVAIVFVDANGRVLQANGPAARLGASGRPSLEGMALADLIGADNADSLLARAGTETTRESPILVHGNDGKTLHLLPVLRRTGNGAIQLVMRDITEEENRRVGLKAYAAHVTRAQEQERQRIARELHDETIQAVILLCLQLDSAEALSEGCMPELSKSIQTARTAAEKVVKGLREFSTSLRPPLLDDLGLVASIRKMLTDLEARSALKVRLRISGEPRRLFPDKEIGLYRIIQEAVSNVERHARARNLLVTIAFTGQDIAITVADDGEGFETKSTLNLLADRHLGIVGMKERADLFGGVLKLESAPGKGTEVTVTAPTQPLKSSDGQHVKPVL